MPFGAFVDVGAMASQRSIRWKSGKGGTDVFFVFTLQPPCRDNVGMCVFVQVAGMFNIRADLCGKQRFQMC